jgi:hypothetical protein
MQINLKKRKLLGGKCIKQNKRNMKKEKQKNKFDIQHIKEIVLTIKPLWDMCKDVLNIVLNIF